MNLEKERDKLALKHTAGDISVLRSAYVILILLILLLASCVTTNSPPENAVPFEEKYDHLLQFPGGTFSPVATDARCGRFFF